jgi:hypothetical protein
MPQSCPGQFGTEKISLSFAGNQIVFLVFIACTPVTNNYTIVASRVLIPVKNGYNDEIHAVRPSSQQFVDQVEHGCVL